MGSVSTVEASDSFEYRLLLRWADKYRNIHVLSDVKCMEDVKLSVSRNSDGLVYSVDNIFKNKEIIDLIRLLIIFFKDAEKRTLYSSQLQRWVQEEFLQIFTIICARSFTLAADFVNLGRRICLTEKSLTEFCTRFSIEPDVLASSGSVLRCTCLPGEHSQFEFESLCYKKSAEKCCCLACCSSGSDVFSSINDICLTGIFGNNRSVYLNICREGHLFINT